MTQPFTLTAEQTTIRAAAVGTKTNLLVNARAGAAKTTTLVLLAEALAPVETLCLAFNKKIAVELQDRLPANATAQTLHSLGNGAIKGLLGKWPKLNNRKVYTILKSIIESLDPADQTEAFGCLSELIKMVSHAKSQGYLPEGVNKLAKPLMDRGELELSLEEIPTELQLYLLDLALKESFVKALTGEIDFDDMIYIPALMPVSFSYYPEVMVDEAQDLSPLNHAILKKLCRRSRLTAVGDPCQAIYAFRGASNTSMQQLRETFSMEEHFLTICFRSSEAVVRNARWRAPDMQWGPTPPEGKVERLSAWGVELLNDGDAIVCRNNAPLFRMALDLLRVGRSPELYSGDIVAKLGKIFKLLGKPKTPTAEAEAELDQWRERQEKKERSKSSVADTYECILLFLQQAQTLGEAIDIFESVVNVQGRIKLMTGHKSKGLEFDRVWFLDQHLVDIKRGQDHNLKYVIETRAKKDLFYVSSDDFGKTGEVAA